MVTATSFLSITDQDLLRVTTTFIEAVHDCRRHRDGGTSCEWSGETSECQSQPEKLAASSGNRPHRQHWERLVESSYASSKP